jgi:hypothetical protein
MIANVVDYIEGTISSGRHRFFVNTLLWSAYKFARAFGLRHLHDLALQGIILQSEALNDEGRAEAALLEYAQTFGLKWSVLRRYTTEQMQSSARTLIASGRLPSDQQQLLQANVFYKDGMPSSALDVLGDFTSKNYNVRYAATSLKRSIYHAQGMPSKVAELLVDFLNAEPDRILIRESVTAARAAEASNREDIFAIAASRILDDVEKVKRDPKLFRLLWGDAAFGAASTFDLDSACLIAERAATLNLTARHTVDEYQQIRLDFGRFITAIQEAHHDLLVRCGRKAPSEKTGDAIVVIPGAAVRSNKIDYPGFRADVRFCVKTILSTLEDAGIAYKVASRINNHGELSFDVPFFSYHTISSGSRGLHFKETDRRSLFSFDDSGYAGWSSFASTGPGDWIDGNIEQDTADAFFQKDRREFLASRASKYAQKDCAEDLPDSFIFVALQVVGDAVQSLAYASTAEMLDEVIAVAKSNRLSVVVKRHPSCKSPEITSYLRKVASDICLVTGNVHDILPRARAVCVVNSGVGAEALIYEKPVYVFGRADYMPACFVCREPGEFSDQFEVDKAKLSPSELRRFWFAYRTKYACDLRNQKEASSFISAKVLHHLTRNKPVFSIREEVT